MEVFNTERPSGFPEHGCPHARRAIPQVVPTRITRQAANKRPNSLRKAGKKRERAAMRDLCRSSDRSTAGVVLPLKSDSFVFLYSVGLLLTERILNAHPTTEVINFKYLLNNIVMAFHLQAMSNIDVQHGA